VPGARLAMTTVQPGRLCEGLHEEVLRLVTEAIGMRPGASLSASSGRDDPQGSQDRAGRPGSALGSKYGNLALPRPWRPMSGPICVEWLPSSPFVHFSFMVGPHESRDQYGELSAMATTVTGVPRLSFAYQRDELGRIAQKTETGADVCRGRTRGERAHRGRNAVRRHHRHWRNRELGRREARGQRRGGFRSRLAVRAEPGEKTLNCGCAHGTDRVS